VKPFGPVPTEVWTMLAKGQGKRGVKISEEQMKAQAADIEKMLTAGKIDRLVDKAPFADEEMRERVRENLKARVAWMGAFARGEVDLPRPLEGDAAHDSLFEKQKDLKLHPEQEDALSRCTRRRPSRRRWRWTAARIPTRSISRSRSWARRRTWTARS
jgi:hypothetical protein